MCTNLAALQVPEPQLNTLASRLLGLIRVKQGITLHGVRVFRKLVSVELCITVSGQDRADLPSSWVAHAQDRCAWRHGVPILAMRTNSAPHFKCWARSSQPGTAGRRTGVAPRIEAGRCSDLRPCPSVTNG